MGLIKENLIIRDAFKNINKNLEILKTLDKKEYNNWYLDYRELIGHQMWLNKDNENEIVFEVLDFDGDLKKLIDKLQK